MDMNKITIFLVLALLLFSGCKKYLDVKSDSTLIVPSNLDDLQQQAVAGLDRMVVDVPRVRQVHTGRLLAQRGFEVAGQGR